MKAESINIRCDQETSDKAKELAAQFDMPVSWIIRTLIHQAYAKNKNEKKELFRRPLDK